MHTSKEKRICLRWFTFYALVFWAVSSCGLYIHLRYWNINDPFPATAGNELGAGWWVIFTAMTLLCAILSRFFYKRIRNR